MPSGPGDRGPLSADARLGCGWRTTRRALAIKPVQVLSERFDAAGRRGVPESLVIKPGQGLPRGGGPTQAFRPEVEDLAQPGDREVVAELGTSQLVPTEPCSS